jgi:hypothetical protein
MNPINENATVGPQWTLEEGVLLCRLVEQTVIPAGYHCALGGGVLHRGESDKDLDIFIYPHSQKLNEVKR